MSDMDFDLLPTGSEDTSVQDTATGGLNDVALDLGDGGDLNLSLDDGDGSSFDMAELDKAMGLEGLDLGDEGLDLGVTDEGMEIALDFEEDEGISASTLLKSQVDLSKNLIPYYQSVLNVLDKLFHAEPKKEVQKAMPPYSDFNYIPDAKIRSMVYRFFCTMMEDLTTLPEYAHMDESAAYQEMLRELNNDLHWTPNVNEHRFYECFTAYYGRNRKLAGSHVATNTVKTSDLVDKERLQIAVDVYYVNSMPWDWVSRFFDDDKVVGTLNGFINLDILGDFAQELLSKRQVRKLSYKMVHEGIMEFFGSEDLMQILKLSEDDIINLSVGELLRRLVVYELNDGTFCPDGMDTLPSLNPDKTLISQVLACLVKAIGQQSIAAEILFMILDLINVAGKVEYFREFVVGLAQYLNLYSKNRAYVNPVFYTFIGNAGLVNGKQQFELAYAVGDESVSFRSEDILYSVIGNNNNVFQVPLIYVDDYTHSVVCPPNEVVSGIRNATIGAKMTISGSVCFKFSPSFSWLSTLNLATDKGEDEEAAVSPSMVRNSSPLLVALMNYDNKFTETKECPRMMTISTPAGEFTAMQRDGEDSILVLQLVQNGIVTPIGNGRCVLDSDGTGVVQYVSPTGEEHVDILEEGQFNTTLFSKVRQEEERFYPTVQEAIGFDAVLGEVPENIYLSKIVQRVCEMTSFDYNMMLNDVRKTIIRDLGNVVGLRALEPAIGYKILETFIHTMQEATVPDTFNLAACKELLDLIVGPDNVLTGVTEITPNVISALNSTYESLRQDAENQMQRATNYDPAVLALHQLSRGENRPYGMEAAYYAMHYLPSIHAKLRNLEDCMVLIQILYEVGPEVENVLRRSQPLYSFYTKVCTPELFDIAEGELKSRVRKLKLEHPLPVVRKLFQNNLPNNFSLAKYFVLDRNLHGLLACLEEYIDKEAVQFKPLYNQIHETLGLDEGVSLSAMSEREFEEKVAPEKVAEVYGKYHDDLMNVVHTGAIPEVRDSFDLQMFKAYDLLCSYGSVLLNLTIEDAEDFSQTKEWEEDFFKYVGSMIISYCPVTGEGANDIDGGIDRWSAYLRNRKDFVSYIPLDRIASLGLQDLRTVISANDPTLEGDINGV